MCVLALFTLAESIEIITHILYVIERANSTSFEMLKYDVYGSANSDNN